MLSPIIIQIITQLAWWRDSLSCVRASWWRTHCKILITTLSVLFGQKKVVSLPQVVTATIVIENYFFCLKYA